MLHGVECEGDRLLLCKAGSTGMSGTRLRGAVSGAPQGSHLRPGHAADPAQGAERPHGQIFPVRPVDRTSAPVSYTHLRAHETGAYL
eukprot:3441016-Pyramimonas_sp.AAC.1